MARATNSRQSVLTLWISIAFTVLLILIAQSFPKYFFLNPSNINPLLGFFQTLYTTGWFLLAAAPPLLMIITTARTRALYVWLIVAVSVFPLAVIGDHVALVALYGNPYFDYLLTYPIIFVSHLFIPAAYIVIFARAIRSISSTAN